MRLSIRFHIYKDRGEPSWVHYSGWKKAECHTGYATHSVVWIGNKCSLWVNVRIPKWKHVVICIDLYGKTQKTWTRTWHRAT